MSTNHILSFGVLGLALFLGWFLLKTPPPVAPPADELTFSNTMTWDSDLLALSSETTRYPASLFANIALPPPPSNSSPETAEELALLHDSRALRTPKKLADIENEINFTLTVPFAGHTVETYKDVTQFPATAELLKGSLYDMSVITMREKRRFDRVRPHKLDPTLDTVVAVPDHPSYPSGHSTQAHFIAYVFSELAPLRKAEFTAQADQIATNREIAGLHYPSDTKAGALLAQQIVGSLMKNPRFQTLLVAAKKEWSTGGLTASQASAK